MTDLEYFLLGAMVTLAVLIAYSFLTRRTPVDRDEDGAQSEWDAEVIVDASRPAELQDESDSPPRHRPHVRAGTAWGERP